MGNGVFRFIYDDFFSSSVLFFSFIVAGTGMASSSAPVNPSNARNSVNYIFLGFLVLLIIPFLFLFAWFYRNKKKALVTYVIGDEDKPHDTHKATEEEKRDTQEVL